MNKKQTYSFLKSRHILSWSRHILSWSRHILSFNRMIQMGVREWRRGAVGILCKSVWGESETGQTEESFQETRDIRLTCFSLCSIWLWLGSYSHSTRSKWYGSCFSAWSLAFLWISITDLTKTRSCERDDRPYLLEGENVDGLPI